MTAEPAADSTAALDQVLADTWPLLLDFDGPVTFLFADGRNRMVADQMRASLPPGYDIPVELRDTPDPLVILRWTAQHAPHDLAAQASTTGEVEAAKVADLTGGVRELLQACVEVGRPVVIASNNAEAAIETFLHRFELRHLVQAVLARIPGQPELMKPTPPSLNAPSPTSTSPPTGASSLATRSPTSRSAAPPASAVSATPRLRLAAASFTSLEPTPSPTPMQHLPTSSGAAPHLGSQSPTPCDPTPCTVDNGSRNIKGRRKRRPAAPVLPTVRAAPPLL